MPAAAIASRASAQNSRAVSAHSAASSTVGSASPARVPVNFRLPGGPERSDAIPPAGVQRPGLDQVAFDTRREILAPHYAHPPW